jgi:hypothetical protein
MRGSANLDRWLHCPSPQPSPRERGEGESSASATAPTISGLPSMPILIAETTKSSSTALICAATIAGGE